MYLVSNYWRRFSVYAVVLNNEAANWTLSKTGDTVRLSNMQAKHQLAWLCGLEVIWLLKLWPQLGFRVDGPTCSGFVFKMKQFFSGIYWSNKYHSCTVENMVKKRCIRRNQIKTKTLPTQITWNNALIGKMKVSLDNDIHNSSWDFEV